MKKRGNKRNKIILLSIILFAILSLFSGIYFFVFEKPGLLENLKGRLFEEKIRIEAYEPDTLGLADGEHVIFIDKNNPNCNNDYTREELLADSSKSWCDNSKLIYYPEYKGFLPGDKIFYRNGTYGAITLKSPGDENNYISFQPYPGDNVTITSGKIYAEWNDLGNGIYSKVIPELYYHNSVKRGGYGISFVNSLEDIYNPPDKIKDYDLLWVDANSKEYFLRLVSGTPDDVFFADRNCILIKEDSPYIEIKGFLIEYCYDGIKSYSSNLRIINNTIRHTGGGSSDSKGAGAQGILAEKADNSLIEGNNISYIGKQWKYADHYGYFDWYKNNFDHALYLSGNSMIIKNNFLTKCNSACLNIGSSDNIHLSKNIDIFRNYIEGFAVGGYEISNLTIYNNIFYNDFYLYPSTDIKVYNNLIIPNAKLNYFGKSVDFSFINNIVINVPNSYCNEIDDIDFSKSFMDKNIYFGCKYWYIWNGEGFDRFYNFEDYKNKLKSYNPDLEKNSFFANPLIEDDSRLMSESPAIDNGACLVSEDYYGNKRPSGNGCDIGPFEYYNTICGDGICDANEDCSSCASDCRSCPPLPCVNCEPGPGGPGPGGPGPDVSSGSVVNQTDTTNIDGITFFEPLENSEPRDREIEIEKPLSKVFFSNDFVNFILFWVIGVLIVIISVIIAVIFKKMQKSRTFYQHMPKS